MDGPAKSSSEKVFRGAWRISIALLVVLLLFLAWLVRAGKLFDAGSEFGYNLGLVGGLLMLSLLLYPLRKRIPALERLGKMESWFKFHMIAGITGPLLVLFHSTFRTGSLNGAMALYAMLLVACSGVVGRFIYRHIHQGLYGKALTLADATAELKASAETMGSVFTLRPDIEPRLQAFHDEAFTGGGSLPVRIWQFVTLRWRGRRLAGELRRDAKSALRRQWRQQGGDRKELALKYQTAKERIDNYLEAVAKTSQLAVWEKLFSYWHIVHIPFLYLLVFSGIVHVVAVHMY
ncbi:MAG: hypothetical protein KA538_04875 [Azonexus sp.]|nr:hypothetical protein [Azonexus sp.]